MQKIYVNITIRMVHCTEFVANCSGKRGCLNMWQAGYFKQTHSHTLVSKILSPLKLMNGESWNPV